MQNLSRQAKIDKVMCKPGYTWNETLKKCLAAVAPVMPEKPKDKPATPPVDDAIKQEKAKRIKGNGNGGAAPAMKPLK